MIARSRSLASALRAGPLLLLAALTTLPAWAAESTVTLGLERVAAGEVDWSGKRIGLVVHAASVTEDGRHAIDVFRDRGLDVVRLFSPEHGLRGRAAAGERVESGRDPVTGLPVVSLYGEHRKPSAKDLDGLDLLIFDLQGAGVRFYTYVSTLILCLEAAAEADLDMVVLDRPNPLGGERVEGPVSASREIVPRSFVNTAPGPLVHGLTLGEMARLVHTESGATTTLSVVAMRGWERTMTWSETGRTWTSPSPNLRSADAALAYPGTALLESTNLSEGRGTEAPFLLLGAPWLDPAKVEVGAPGFELEPATFTPTSSPVAPSPKFVDQSIRGFRVRVSDTATAQPYRLGVELLVALRANPNFELRREGGALTWLVGTDRLLDHLESGKTVDAIVDADSADQEEWRSRRQPHLLY